MFFASKPPRLLQALYQLYFDPDMEKKNIAQKWLTQAQASAQAWHFCWCLLSPEKIPEVQFFGASTLHTKISRHWSDLPTDHHENLRMQLLTQVLRFSCGPKIVLTRLCVALASMALNLIPQAWSHPVADMVRAFQPNVEDDSTAVKESQGPPQAHCLALLELLTVLPEELQSSRLTRAHRGQLRGVLASEWTVVCPLLRQLLQNQDSSNQVKEKVMHCLSSWVGLDVPLEESQELVQDCFGTLSDPELFDTAVETIVNVLSQPDCQRYVGALVSLVPLVLGFREQLDAAAQNGNMETSHGLCRIAIAMGETHSRLLLENSGHWQEFLALVNMILFCTGIPGHYPVTETSSSLTLTFWYTLQDDILSFDEEKQAVYLQIYRPVYFQLVDVLLHKSQYPSQEEYESWSSDDKEQFRMYRIDISDTLMYVYEMLGSELLSNLYDKLGMQLMDPQYPVVWQDTEALLFGFQSIAETIDVNYSDVIPGLIGLIPRINISNVMLADTVMYTIGSLAEWLADHPVMLGSILPMVLQGLGKAELSVSSVSTLKRICRECRHDLGPFAQDILSVSQEVLVKEIHKSSQCIWLMQAMGFLLSALPVEEILGRLHILIGPHIQQLDTATQQEPNPSNKQTIVYVLGLLASLFTSLDINKQAESSEESTTLTLLHNKQNPVVVMLQQVFPLIESILTKWLHDSEVVEAVCGVFDKSVRTLLHDFGPVVAQLSEMLGRIYTTFPQASALDLTSQMIHIFSADDQHTSNIRVLTEVLTASTLSMFQQGKDEKSRNLFDLDIHFSKPDLYLSDQLDVKALFYCGKHSSAHVATITEINTSICIGTQAVGGASPRSLTDHFSEVLLSLNRHYPVLLTQWLTETLQTPGFPSAHVSTEQKHTFTQQLLREQTNKRRVKEIVKEFSLLCRGLQGWGYSDY
uniref:Importin-13 n=1 Tax=Gouania willdenowi TaxID=441366 RepID=A0A8C5HGS1_GOUWI